MDERFRPEGPPECSPGHQGLLPKRAGGPRECSPGRDRPGLGMRHDTAPEGRKSWRGILRASGAVPFANFYPGLTVGATLWPPFGPEARYARN
jgi:hypothetical protein